MEPVINLITPPDKLYNGNLSFLLVSPSDDKKEQFNQMAKRIGQDLNVYLFDKTETDVPWLLDVGQEVDHIILDIDNIPQEYQWLIGYFLSFNKTFYLTSAEQMSYNVINTRRIYDVGQIAEENDSFVKFQGKT
jgi:hypothetical protein|tara:strand:- start:823 stop:1224 length:402 start_codon:yes stop_codon:yes gene_type:complete